MLAVSVGFALHYRGEAARPGQSRPPATSAAVSPMPQLTSVALALPAAGGVGGTVVITAAALPGAGLAQFTVSAVIAGALPDTFYDLATTARARPRWVTTCGRPGSPIRPARRS